MWQRGHRYQDPGATATSEPPTATVWVPSIIYQFLWWIVIHWLLASLPTVPNLLGLSLFLKVYTGKFLSQTLSTHHVSTHLMTSLPLCCQIFEGDQLVRNLCGRRAPEIIKMKSHMVDILFQTDDSGDSRGWKIFYTSEGKKWSVVLMSSLRYIDICQMLLWRWPPWLVFFPAIQCPKPVTLDEFSIVSPKQEVYRMRDYFVLSCRTGYRLMEVWQEVCLLTLSSSPVLQ